MNSLRESRISRCRFVSGSISAASGAKVSAKQKAKVNSFPFVRLLNSRTRHVESKPQSAGHRWRLSRQMPASRGSDSFRFEALGHVLVRRNEATDAATATR